MTAVCFVLLAEETEFSIDEFQRQYQDSFPAFPAASKVTADENTVSIDFGEDSVVLGRMGAPIPDLAEEQFSPATLWTDAADQIGQHRDHWVITAVSAQLSLVEQATLVSRVTSAILRAHPSAVGILWGQFGLKVSAENFCNVMGSLDPGELPLTLWVDINVIPSSSELGAPTDDDVGALAMTTGMSAFEHHEIECIGSPESSTELFERVFGICHHLLENGPVIADGDTIGESAEERIQILIRPSTLTGRDEPVMHLVYPRGGDAQSDPKGVKPWVMAIGCMAAFFGAILLVVLAVSTIYKTVAANWALAQQPPPPARAQSSEMDRRAPEPAVAIDPPALKPSEPAAVNDPPAANPKIAINPSPAPPSRRRGTGPPRVEPPPWTSPGFKRQAPPIPRVEPRSSSAPGSAVASGRPRLEMPTFGPNAGAHPGTRGVPWSTPRFPGRDEPKKLAPGELIATLDGLQSPIKSLAFSPEGQFLAIGSVGGKVLIVESDSLRTIATAPQSIGFGTVTALTFSADQTQLVCGSQSGRLCRYSVDESGQPSPPADLVAHKEAVRSIAINAQGSMIVSLDHGGGLLWQRSTATGNADSSSRFLQTDLDEGRALFLDAAGKSVLVSDGQKIQSVDLRERVVRKEHKLGRAAGSMVAFSSSGTRLVIGRGPEVNVFQVDRGEPTVRVRLPMGVVWSVGFSGSEELFFASANGRVLVWRADTGASVADIDAGGAFPIHHVAMHPDGTRLVASPSIPSMPLRLYRLPQE